MRSDPRQLIRRLVLALASALLTAVAALIICIVLVRFAPGFGSDIRELDPRLRQESVKALQAARATGNLWETAQRLGLRVLSGDLGDSQAFQRPIRELIAERVIVTAKPLLAGILIGWGAALVLSLLNRISIPLCSDLTRSVCSWLLCIPAPVMALALLTRSSSPDVAGLWVGAVVGLIVFPRMLLLIEEILSAESCGPHVEYARNKGLTRRRILFAHVLWPAAPAILAAAGSSVGVALSGVMPIEVVCDSPGLGQLAWLATQQRDLPLLVTVTFLVTLTVIFASSFNEVIRFRPVQMGHQS